MKNAHYFNQQSQHPDHYFRIAGKIGTTALELWSAKGLFSMQAFDVGTKILLKSFTTIDSKYLEGAALKILDLGCGYGLVSSYLASNFTIGGLFTSEHLHIDACDSSELACDLTSYNLQYYSTSGLSYHVQQSDGLSDPYFDDKSYEHILCNPPFSAGKSVVHQLIQQARHHLASHGELWLVVPTKKGAKSYINRCREHYGEEYIHMVTQEAGYRVWKIYK